eukprot:jgi/Mesvir1/1633/Mv05069-RA.1
MHQVPHGSISHEWQPGPTCMRVGAAERALALKEAQLSDRDAKVAELERQLAEALKATTERKDEASSIQARIVVLERQLAETQAKLEEMTARTAEVSSYPARAAELERQLAEKRGLLKEQAQLVGCQSEGGASCQAKVAKLEGQFAETRAKLKESVEKSVEQISEKMSATAEEVKRSTARTADLNEQLQRTQARAVTAELALADKEKALVERDAQLLNQQARADDLEEQLQSTRCRLARQLQQSHASAGELKEQLRQCTARAEAAEAAMPKKDYALAELQAQLLNQQTRAGEVEGQLQKSTARAEAAEAAMAEHGKILDKRDAQLLSQQTMVVELEGQLQQSQARVREKEKALEERAQVSQARAEAAEAALAEKEAEVIRRDDKIDWLWQHVRDLELLLTVYDKGKLGVKDGTQHPGGGGQTKPITRLGELSDDAHLIELQSKKLQEEMMDKDQELLIQECVTGTLGFHNERPVAACLLFRTMLHWDSFRQERTNIFDNIVIAMSSAIEPNLDNNEVLAYWLSNTSTLLHLLQRMVRTSAASSKPRPLLQRNNLTFLGRTMQRLLHTRAGADAPGSPQQDLVGIQQLDAKYPALLFKKQLTSIVEKIYELIRDSIKKELIPLLSLCIKMPKPHRDREETGARGGAVAVGSTLGLDGSVSNANNALTHWHQIIHVLTRLLGLLRANHVPGFLVQKLFMQLFSFINVQLFNGLLLHRECCSFSNGEYMKTGLGELESWIKSASVQWMGDSWEELKYIRQAITFLVIHQKAVKTLHEITNELCPVLSVQQLYRISTMYWDDKYGTKTVSKEVLAAMKYALNKANDRANAFLLDDDTFIPFSMDEFSKCMPDLVLDDFPLPMTLSEHPSFNFLLDRASGERAGE